MKRIYLIDCPGVVPPSNTDTPQDILLRGVVRVENVENPEQYIPAVLKKTKPQHIERTYELKGYKDHIQFLELLARKGGRLLRGGEPDVDGVAKMVLNDFLRGKIPWFTPPPITESGEEKGVEGRDGRLGEMGKKRKLDDATSAMDASSIAPDSSEEDSSDDAEDGEFEGFDSDNGAEADEDGDEEDDEASQLEDSDGDAAGAQLQHELDEAKKAAQIQPQPSKKRRKT